MSLKRKDLLSLAPLSAEEITLFKSLGLAVEDLAAAQFLFDWRKRIESCNGEFEAGKLMQASRER